VLRTGVELPVSRGYRKPLHERLVSKSPPA